MIRVVVVDDHPAVRAGLHTMLRAEPGIVPVAIAETAREAVTKVRSESPQVAVVDLRLPDGDGLHLCRRLRRLTPPPAVLLYSAFAGEDLAVPALLAGAGGLIDKRVGGHALSDAVRSVARGQRVLPPIGPGLLERAADCLDPEDLPIVGMAVDGAGQDEVGQVLNLAPEELEARIDRMLLALVPEFRQPGPGRA